MLNVIDNYSGDCLACFVDTSLSGRRVIRELAVIAERHGPSCMVVSDNGTEQTSHTVPLVPRQRGRMTFTVPGKLQQNGSVERFNGRLRDECLNEQPVPSLATAKRSIDAWRSDYSTVRPHSNPGRLAPAEVTNRPAKGIWTPKLRYQRPEKGEEMNDGDAG